MNSVRALAYLRDPANRDAILARLVGKVDRVAGCWVWAGYKNERGYGQIGIGPGWAGKTKVHRLAYELLVGPIPDGFVIDHLCRNPSCVNPLHLEAVTQGENLRRGVRATKGFCVNGHAYTPDNTIRAGGSGWRVCRHCRSLRKRNRGKSHGAVTPNDFLPSNPPTSGEAA